MMWLAKSQSLRHWKTARFSSLFCSLTSSKCTLWWFYQKERGVSQVHVYALVVMYVVRLGLCVVNQLTHTSFLSLCCMLPYVITLLVFLSSVLCVWLWLLLSGVLSGGWFCRQHTIIPFHMLKCCDLSDNGVAAEDQTLFSSVWSYLLWMLDIMYIKMALCLGKYIWLALKIELHFSSVYTLLFTGFLGLWSGSMEADIYGVLYGLLKHGEHSCFAGSEADFSSSSSTGSIKGRGTMANNSRGEKNCLSHRWSIVPQDFGINTHSSFFIYININGEAHFIAHLLGWFKMLYHFVECFYISQVPSYSSSVIASNQSCCLVFSAL